MILRPAGAILLYGRISFSSIYMINSKMKAFKDISTYSLSHSLSPLSNRLQNIYLHQYSSYPIQFTTSLTLIQIRKTHYESLGLPHNASEKEIRSKFHQLSKQYHPDLNRHKSLDIRRTSRRRFLKIKDAYETLSNKTARAEYDTKLGSNNRNRSSSESYDADSSQYSYNNATKGSYYSRSRTRSHHYHYANPSANKENNTSTNSNNTDSNTTSNTGRRKVYYGDERYQGRGFEKYSRTIHNSNLNGMPQTGLNNDVPHFDYDLHLQHQKKYDELRSKSRKLKAENTNSINHGYGNGYSGSMSFDDIYSPLVRKHRLGSGITFGVLVTVGTIISTVALIFGTVKSF